MGRVAFAFGGLIDQVNRPTIIIAENKVERIKNEIKELNIAEVDTNEFDATVILFYMIETGTFNAMEVANETGISIKFIYDLLGNWLKCGILTDEGFIMDSDAKEDEIGFFIELMLIMMTGLGVIQRTTIQ
jgi:hypothetical protein